jgi:hypothetical protein
MLIFILFLVCSTSLLSIKDQIMESKPLDPLKTINSVVYSIPILAKDKIGKIPFKISVWAGCYSVCMQSQHLRG